MSREMIKKVVRNLLNMIPSENVILFESLPDLSDNTMPVLNLYFKGAYSEDEALRRLLPQRLRDQFAMKTDAALACLKFIEGSVV